MSDHDESLFADIQRIEQQADALLAEARSKADELAKKTGEDIKALAADTDAEIEKTNAALAEDYRAKTEQALSQIDVEFLKKEEALETARERRFDELVGWAASHISEQLLSSGD